MGGCIYQRGCCYCSHRVGSVANVPSFQRFDGTFTLQDLKFVRQETLSPGNKHARCCWYPSFGDMFWLICLWHALFLWYGVECALWIAFHHFHRLGLSSLPATSLVSLAEIWPLWATTRACICPVPSSKKWREPGRLCHVIAWNLPIFMWICWMIWIFLDHIDVELYQNVDARAFSPSMFCSSKRLHPMIEVFFFRRWITEEKTSSAVWPFNSTKTFNS